MVFFLIYIHVWVSVVGEYHVERIVQHKRGKGKKLLYEVKWLNYNDHDNTWEPGENIYEYCLYEYWSKVGTSSQA